MTLSYKFVKDIFTNQHCGILRTKDGITSHIPFNQANTDYQEYIKWCNGENPYTEKGVTEEAD